MSRWRIAGNGADMIRPDVMQSFVDAFADAGFGGLQGVLAGGFGGDLGAHGGLGTVLVAALWWRLFPGLARRDHLSRAVS